MAIGTIANTAFAFQVIYGKAYDLSTRERLLLMLLSDACSGGLGVIDLEAFAEYTAAPSATDVHDDLKALSRHGLLQVSDIHDGEAAIALVVAEPAEISQARKALDCNLPFRDWKT